MIVKRRNPHWISECVNIHFADYENVQVEDPA